MRSSQILAIVGLSLLFGTIGLMASQTFPPFEKEVADNFGHLKWRSAVKLSEEAPNNWVFHYEVWNLDPDRNCRIDWRPVGLQSLIPPKENAYRKSSVPSRPREYDGVLYRAGGIATGQKEEKTKVYLPEGHEALVSSTARIFVESEDELKPLTVSGDVVFEQMGEADSLRYQLAVDGLDDIRFNQFNGQARFEVTWEADEPYAVFGGPLQSDGESVKVIEVLEGVHVAVTSEGVIKVKNLDGEVVAEVAMPSLVPNRG